jgi:surface protein
MGLFQHDFIYIIFGKMMVSKLQRSDADIKKAVNDWCKDPVKATAKYGHFSKWNASIVTDMKGLFHRKRDFNDDISKWNVSNVTDMSFMFSSTPFNGDISGWNVIKVTNIRGMFICAVSFNGDISGWDVSNVTDMESMFSETQHESLHNGFRQMHEVMF